MLAFFFERLAARLEVKSFVVNIAVPWVSVIMCEKASVPKVSYKGTLMIP